MWTDRSKGLPVKAPDNKDPVLGAGDKLVPGIREGDVEHLVSVAQGSLQHLCKVQPELAQGSTL